MFHTAIQQSRKRVRGDDRADVRGDDLVEDAVEGADDSLRCNESIDDLDSPPLPGAAAIKRFHSQRVALSATRAQPLLELLADNFACARRCGDPAMTLRIRFLPADVLGSADGSADVLGSADGSADVSIELHTRELSDMSGDALALLARFLPNAAHALRLCSAVTTAPAFRAVAPRLHAPAPLAGAPGAAVGVGPAGPAGPAVGLAVIYQTDAAPLFVDAREWAHRSPVDLADHIILHAPAAPGGFSTPVKRDNTRDEANKWAFNMTLAPTKRALSL
jgi:hypothetical protein